MQYYEMSNNLPMCQNPQKGKSLDAPIHKFRNFSKTIPIGFNVDPHICLKSCAGKNALYNTRKGNLYFLLNISSSDHWTIHTNQHSLRFHTKGHVTTTSKIPNDKFRIS